MSALMELEAICWNLHTGNETVIGIEKKSINRGENYLTHVCRLPRGVESFEKIEKTKKSEPSGSTVAFISCR